jgi:hypothetical protein
VLISGATGMCTRVAIGEVVDAVTLH